MINFESEFRKTKGQPFTTNGTEYRMFYELETGENTEIHIKIITFIKSPRQGIRFDSESQLSINNKCRNSFSIWASTAPLNFSIQCTPHSKITIRNIWDNGDGTEQSWHAGGALIVSPQKSEVLLRGNSTLRNDQCNDIEVLIHY